MINQHNRRMLIDSHSATLEHKVQKFRDSKKKNEIFYLQNDKDTVLNFMNTIEEKYGIITKNFQNVNGHYELLLEKTREYIR